MSGATTPRQNRLAPPLTLALWCAVTLAAVGVAAALGRAAYPGDFTTRAEPFRQGIMAAFDRHDPRASERPAELEAIDRRFAHNPISTLLHVIPGGLFLLLAPLQFSKHLRRRHLRLHHGRAASS